MKIYYKSYLLEEKNTLSQCFYFIKEYCQKNKIAYRRVRGRAYKKYYTVFCDYHIFKIKKERE